MKKLLLIGLFIIVGLGIFFALPTSNEPEPELETDYVGIIVGLNGIEYEYIVKAEEPSQGVLAAEDLDKNKYPSYALDINDAPVAFKTVGELLKAKYYGSALDSADYFRVGFQAKMRMTINDASMSTSEFMARTVLLTEELRLYQYWLVGGSELYLQITLNGVSFEIFIYMPNLTSDAFKLTLEDYYYELWEIETTNLTFNLVDAQTYYNDFILNEDFIGYVLNYT